MTVHSAVISELSLFIFVKSVKDNLKTACEGKANVSKAFIDTVLLQQLAPIILNEVRYDWAESTTEMLPLLNFFLF